MQAFETTRRMQKMTHAIVTLLLMTITVLATAAHAQQATITLRTLAQIQQWQDEMNLREKIETLHGKTRLPRSDVQAAPSHTAAARPLATVSKVKAASARRPALKLLSVYGPAHRLSAEAVDASGQVHAVEARDFLGQWVVGDVRQEGILLHRDGVQGSGKFGIFVAVGEALDDGVKP